MAFSRTGSASERWFHAGRNGSSLPERRAIGSTDVVPAAA
jgi:hypothetical protein